MSISKKILFHILQTICERQKCGVQPNYHTTKIYLKRSMVTYTIFFVCVIMIDFMYNQMNADSFIRSSTVYTIPNIISTLALTQFATVLHCIRDKFRTINLVLKQLQSNSFTEHQLINNKLNIFVVLPVSRGRNSSERILNILRKQHGELSRLTELLNKCFGLLIILTLIAAYVILSIQFYAFYKMKEGFKESDIWLTLYTILWVILHSGKFLLILYPINNVSDEKKRAGSLLYQMDYNKMNATVSKAVKTFADQLLHETSPPNAMRIIN